MEMAAIVKFGFCFVLLIAIVSQVRAGECCTSYYDKYSSYNDGFWCSNYCCYKTILFARQSKTRECCDNILYRVDWTDREDTCSYWWSSHGWVPALIGIGCIAAIAACCFGCFKLCCSQNHNRTGVVMQPQAVAVISHAQPQHAMYPPVVQSTNVQQTNVNMSTGVPAPGTSHPASAYPPPPYNQDAAKQPL